MEYQLDKWKRQNWRKDARHYSYAVRQNLFGQWVMLRRWGRVSAFQGQSAEKVCDRTLPHSRFSPQDEEPLVVLLEPVVYVFENLRLSCEVFC